MTFYNENALSGTSTANYILKIILKLSIYKYQVENAVSIASYSFLLDSNLISTHVIIIYCIDVSNIAKVILFDPQSIPPRSIAQ